MRLFLAVFVFSMVFSAFAEPKKERPNVMLILIDDLSHYGVTAYGANRLTNFTGDFELAEFSTPNIDELARTGLRADHAYAYPLCENTRVALMSGKGNHRNYLQPKSLHHSEITFGDAFKRAGYTTGLFGKWKQSRGTKEIQGSNYINEFGWDEYTAFDVVTAGARMINPDLIVNGKAHNYKGRTDKDPDTGRRWFGPDIVNRHAQEFIEKHREQPFFLYYPMLLVHDEHTPTPDTQPQSVFNSFPEFASGKRIGDEKKYFPDMVEYADKMIGQLVRKLEQQGLRENTLIIVVGDNGTKEAFGHILAGGELYPARKGGNTDNGLHVPLVLNMPGTISNNTQGEYRSYQGMVDITDIYPTIAEAASVSMPRAELVDGISFWQQAKGMPGEHREHIYRWYLGNNIYKQFDNVGISFVFNRQFKRYRPSKLYPQGRFFDLREDPLERAGDKYQVVRFKVRRYEGLDVDMLTNSQAQGYAKFGKLLQYHQHSAVKEIEILNSIKTLQVGQQHRLDYHYSPTNAQRTGSIWNSDNPDVISINKFGEIFAHKSGIATVSLYSWSDAFPVSSNREPDFYRDGINSEITIEVTP